MDNAFAAGGTAVTFSGKWRNSYGAIWRYVDALDELVSRDMLVGTWPRWLAPGGFCSGVDLLGEVLSVLDEELP